MADPNLKWRDTADVLVGGAEDDFGKVAPGAASSESVYRLYNDFGGTLGSDDARNLVLVAQARIQGTTEWKTSGVDALDRRAIQVQQTEEADAAVTNAWLSMGTGVSLALADLASGERHVFKVRVNNPVGASEVVTEWKLALTSRRFSSSVDARAVEPGIHRGVGDGRTTGILYRSQAIAVSGAGTFEWPDFAWMYEGVPLSVLDHDETITANDGSAVALASGESYLYLAVLDGSTTTIVKGDKVTGTAAYPADAPALPAGNRLLGWGVRDFTANLTFTSLDELPDFFNLTSSALTATIARAGSAYWVDGVKVDPGSSTTATLTDAATNTVQLLQDGSVGVTTDGSLYQPGAQPLGDMVTSGGAVTSQTDSRRWQGGYRVEFSLDAPTGTIRRVRRNPFNRSLWIRPESIAGQLDAIPGAGNVKWDLFTRPDNGSPTTIFTSSGSDDRRPVVSSGDSDATSDINDATPKLPEVLEWKAGEQLVCDTIVTTATPAESVLTLIADLE